MTGITGAVIWLLIAIALFVAEGLTVQLVTVWFGVGALIMIVPAAMGMELWLQLLLFLLVSMVFLLVARPVVKRKINIKRQPTNADMVIGQTGLVLETIYNIQGQGRISVMGMNWAAWSETGDPIAEGKQVLVKRIEGVKLIVTPLEENGGTV